jgi:multisubunit Na+/H+ antiporter MnhB subunit
VPPLLGFLAKESVAAELLRRFASGADSLGDGVALVATVLASAFMVAVAAKLIAGIFLGEPSAAVRSHAGAASRHRELPPLWVAPLLLALAALGLGLLGATPLTEELVAAAASGAHTHLHVSLIPELSPPLYLSAATLALGAALFAARERVNSWQERLPRLPAADALWQRAIDGIATGGERFSAAWQNGSLRWYLTAILAVLPLLTWYALETVDLSYRAISVTLSDMPWYGLLLCVLLAVATLIAVRAETRLQAAIATTTIGFLVSMLFVVYRSPDILLTQILIETVSTIFVLLVLIFLPAFPKQDLERVPRLVNLAVASAFSLAIIVLLLLSMTPGLREPNNIATRPGGILSLALREGGGANAVNVIIADIRAMDTNGEITVLVVVGLCIFGLLRVRRRAT